MWVRESAEPEDAEGVPLATYTAHYRSPNASQARAKGVFEFESEARAGSKENAHDARLAMLQQYGNQALSWVIEDIKLKAAPKSAKNVADGQLELDFREPLPERKRQKRSFERGLI